MCEIHFCKSSGRPVCVSSVSVAHREITKARKVVFKGDSSHEAYFLRRYFHRIEMSFLQNLSALSGQCPLTFEVLPRPLAIHVEAIKELSFSYLH